MSIAPPAPSLPGNLTTVVNVVQTLPPVAGYYGQYVPTVGAWQDYWIQNSYDTDLRVFQMGITSPVGFNGQTVAFVQTAAPTCIWTCEWIASKQGDLPEAPNPVDLVDPGWVLLHTVIQPAMVEVLPDGWTYVYTITGTYWYGHSNPSDIQMFFPKPAWLSDTNPMGRAVDADKFIPGLMDTPGNTGTGDDLIEEVIDAFNATKLGPIPITKPLD